MGLGRKYLDSFTLDEGARKDVSGYEIRAFETGKVTGMKMSSPR
jgi:hypothetical protein